MKKRTSKTETAKQQTGRCPEALPSPPYRGETGGLLASVLLLLLLLHPLVLCKTSIITKKPVVAKRHISIYVHVCVRGGGEECFYMPPYEAQLFLVNIK